MIILVRHGEATHHAEHLTGGWTDSELTAVGRAQLQAVASKLACDFAGQSCNLRLLTSNLKRAVESAQILADKLGFTRLEPYEFLREKNNGQAAGLTETAAKALYQQPTTLKELHHRNYPGGETRQEFYDRTVQGLLKCADLERENLLIVAHKGTIQNIIFHWLGLDIAAVNALNFSVDILPSSVSVLGINKWREHAVFRLNDTSHLHSGSGYGIFEFKYGKGH
ncbi:MAG: histidine phosphatase family protein [Acidaminococcaceae bacterium]|nr:histidine phosphatase family protein [Acidaminococcaceae bacterium]